MLEARDPHRNATIIIPLFINNEYLSTRIVHSLLNYVHLWLYQQMSNNCAKTMKREGGGAELLV